MQLSKFRLAGSRLKPLAAVAATVGVAASLATAGAGVANAGPSDGRSHGQEIKGQAYKGQREGGPEWMGTYKYSGGEAWCVSFGLMEPQRVEKSGAKYVPAGDLKKKDGAELTEEGYAVTAYAVAQGQRVINDPKANDGQKAMYGQAVAFILHKYTAEGLPLGGDQPSDKVGYDTALHNREMPENVRQLKDRLISEGKSKPGPWKLEVVPTDGQTLRVGQETEFKVSLKASNGQAIKQSVELKSEGVDGVPENIELNDNGEATFKATPKEKDAKIDASTDAAPGRLQMLKPDKGNGQNIVKVGAHNIKSSSTALRSSEKGSIVLTKITSGDDQKTPVEGAVVNIYKKEDLEKAGLKVGGAGFEVSDSENTGATSTQDNDGDETSTESSTSSAPSTSSTPSSSKTTSPSTTSPVTGGDEEDNDSTSTTTRPADETRQDTDVETTESSKPSPTTEKDDDNSSSSTSTPSTSSSTKTSEPSKGSDDTPTIRENDNNGDLSNAGFSTVDSSNIEKLETNSKNIINKLKGVKPATTVTTKPGVSLRGSVPVGEYVAVEVEAPTGLALDSKPVAFSVENGKDTDVLLQNTVKATLVKVDKASNEKLGGASYDIKPCEGSETVASLKTDSKGEAVFTLPKGCYQAVEKEAPKGYEKDETPMQFELSRDNTKVIVSDVKEVEKQKPAPRKVEKRVPVKEIPSGPTDLPAGALPEIK